jgi:hypothetical protein
MLRNGNTAVERNAPRAASLPAAPPRHHATTHEPPQRQRGEDRRRGEYALVAEFAELEALIPSE